MRTNRVLSWLVIPISAVALVACGGDDGEESSDSTTTEAPSTTEATSTTTADETTTTVGGGDSGESSDLEGSWVADADDLIGANTANLGGAAGLACTGDVTMTFSNDGTLQRSGELSCSVAGSPIAAEGEVDTTGDYAVEGDTVTISNTQNNGRASLGGQSIPTPDSWGDGEATFQIDGDTLTLTFTATAVGQVTQTYTRSG